MKRREEGRRSGETEKERRFCGRWSGMTREAVKPEVHV